MDRFIDEPDFIKQGPGLSPVSFFQLSADCMRLPSHLEKPFPALTAKNRAKYQLPNTSALCLEETFAELSMGWHQQGIELLITCQIPFQKAFYPNLTEGDSVELFFDTRDVKTTGFNTRFCHHFFFLPTKVDEHLAGEMTHFRTEDSHLLSDPNELKIRSTFKANSYSMAIFVSNQALHGYDPDQFNRLGFTYRINRASGNPQHFSALSREYQIEQQPSLWASLKLIEHAV